VHSPSRPIATQVIIYPAYTVPLTQRIFSLSTMPFLACE
jgi:hypothetical protein